MDDLLNEQPTLTGLFMDPVDKGVERRRIAARFVNSNEIMDDAAEIQAGELARESIQSKAAALISGISDTSQVASVTTQLKEMAVRASAPEPDESDVEAGMADALSDEEDFAKARQDYDKIVSRRRNNLQSIRTFLEEAKNDPELTAPTMFESVNNLVEGTPVEGALRNFRTAREFMSVVAVPGRETAVLGYLLNRLDPEFTIGESFTIGSGLARLREKMIDMPEEELQQFLPELLDAVKDSKLGNNYIANQMLDKLLAGIEEGTGSKMETAMAYLDVLGVGFAVKGTAKLARGVREGSLASTAVRTKAGQKKLGDAVLKNDDATLASVGTTADEVVESTVVPNLGQAAPSSRPYLPDMMLTEAEKLAILPRLAKERNHVLKNKVEVKLNDSSIRFTDDGYEADLVMGLATGRGFKSEGHARGMAAFNRMKRDDYEVVKSPDSEEWFIKTTVSKQFGKSDLLPYQEVLKSGKGFAGGIFGANTHFAAQIVNSANDAAKRSSQMQRVMRETIDPYTRLSNGDKVKVNAALRENDGVKYMTRADMVAKGFNDKQIQAVESVYKAGRIHLAELNNLTRSRMVDNNIKVWRNAEKREFMAAEIDRTAFFPGKKVTNLETGKSIDYEDVRLNLDSYRLFRMMDEQGAPRFGIVRREGVKLDADELPAFVVHQVPGYIPRRYDAPFYIATKADGEESVEMVTVMTARSEKSARDAIERLKIENPETEYTVRRAQEVISQPTTWDELDSLREAGLLVGKSRRKDLIPDADELYNLRGIEESIDAMVESTGRSAGISRWTDAAIARWEATYKKDFGDFSVAAVPKALETNLAVQRKWKEARDLRNHIMMMNGMYQSGVSKLTESFRFRIADALYDRGFTSLGDEVAGRKSAITDAGKTAAGSMFLFLNPVRQALMQMTMIPTYAGVQGGLKYIAGGYQKDWFDVMVRRSGPMFEAWQKHGTGALVDDHILKMGMSADSGFGLAGTFASPLGRGIEFSKKIGFDFGTYNDKLAQFLFSANRFKAQNGRLPSSAKEWDEVAAFGENLGLNMNSSDALLTQQGVFSLFTQFMSHSIKMTGRLLGQEGQFTKAEKARMAAMTALTYGTAGYGMHEAVHRVMDSVGLELDPEIRQLVDEGISGMVLDTIFGMWDTEDEETRLAFAQNFSPASGGFIGITPNLIGRLFNGSASLGHVMGELPFMRDPAALGAGQSVTNALSLAKQLWTQTDMPASEITAAASAKFFESFPVYSNMIRGMAAMRHGQITDGKGAPITDISKGSAIARAMFGIRTKDERALEAAMAEFYGMYTEQSREGMRATLDKDIDATLQWMTPMFNKFSQGEINMKTLSEFLSKHQTAIIDNFGEDHELRSYYLDGLWKGLERSGVTKSQQFAEKLMYEAGRSVTREDVRELIMKHQPPGGQQVVDWINNSLNMRNQQ